MKAFHFSTHVRSADPANDHQMINWLLNGDRIKYPIPWMNGEISLVLQKSSFTFFHYCFSKLNNSYMKRVKWIQHGANQSSTNPFWKHFVDFSPFANKLFFLSNFNFYHNIHNLHRAHEHAQLFQTSRNVIQLLVNTTSQHHIWNISIEKLFNLLKSTSSINF